MLCAFFDVASVEKDELPFAGMYVYPDVHFVHGEGRTCYRFDVRNHPPKFRKLPLVYKTPPRYPMSTSRSRHWRMATAVQFYCSTWLSRVVLRLSEICYCFRHFGQRVTS